MIGLSEEVLYKIKRMLSAGECGQARALLGEISKHYENLDTYFVPRHKFTDHIEYPPDPEVLPTVTKCLDKAEFEIRVEAEPYIRSGFDEDLAEWMSDPFFDTEVEMHVRGLTPEQLEQAIYRINKKDSLCWVMNADKTLSADEFMKLLEEDNPKNTECSYIVSLEQVGERRLALTLVEASFYGEITAGNVAIYVRSRVSTYERYSGLWGSARDHAILDVVKWLWKDYHVLNPVIVFILKPSIRW